MNNLSIIFCGDYAPCRGFESVVLNKQSSVLGDTLPIIENSDLSFVNLECLLTHHCTPIEKSGPALKADPDCIDPLKHFDIVGLANNHVMDYGEVGLKDTLDLCNANNLSTVGAGLTLEDAQKPLIVERKGVKIAVIAIAEFEFNQSENGGPGSAPIDLIDNYVQIKKAQEDADIVIVTIHGGNEYFPYPRPGLRKLCRHFIDLGVAAVVCHHPHVPGAYEVYNDSPIFYSIGNFIFDHSNPPKGWNEGYMVEMSFNTSTKKLKSFELIPYEQSVVLGGVQLLKSNEKAKFLDRVESYRNNMLNEENWLKEWDGFVKKHEDSLIARKYFPVSFRGLGFLSRKFPLARVLLPKSALLAKLNIIRCQSHKELLQAVLEKRR